MNKNLYNYEPKRVSEETFYKVLEFFAKHSEANNTKHLVFSMDDIAESTGLNRATVIRAVKDLVEHGLLIIKGGGGRTPYSYEYLGPNLELAEEKTCKYKLSQARKQIRIYYQAIKQFYNFIERIIEVEKKDNIYIIKVEEDELGTLGLPINVKNLKENLQQQLNELERKIGTITDVD